MSFFGGIAVGIVIFNAFPVSNILLKQAFLAGTSRFRYQLFCSLNTHFISASFVVHTICHRTAVIGSMTLCKILIRDCWVAHEQKPPTVPVDALFKSLASLQAISHVLLFVGLACLGQTGILRLQAGKEVPNLGLPDAN